MTLSNLSMLASRGKSILQEEGVIPLIRQGFLFLIGWAFRYDTYYIYERELNRLDEIQFIPKVENYTLKIISTSEQVDQLAAEGFSINYYPLSVRGIKERLSKKAVSFCVFVGKELIHMTWVARSKEAKRVIDYLPFRVDFQGGEVCSGASFTKPQYRRKGLLAYTYSHILTYLAKQDIMRVKFSIHKNNISSQKAYTKVTPTITSYGHYLKILWYQSWKEESIVSPHPND